MSDTKKPIRISLVNDYEIVVKGLSAMLEAFGDRVTVVETEAGGLPTSDVDITLFDTFAGRKRSLGRIDVLAEDDGIAKVALYTWDLPQGFAAAIDMRGIAGVIMKSASAEQLVDALERMHRGEQVGTVPSNVRDQTPTLTEREREVLALLAQGATNREISEELYLALDTIKTHVRKVFAKLGVANRTQAAIVARDHGLDLSHQNSLDQSPHVA